jgi:hypothetical protein
MAIYFPNSNALLLLTPKTGTVWVREALKCSGVYHIPIGPPELRFHGYLSLFGRGFSGIAAFVRNPISWHRSYWAYRCSPDSKWDQRWNIDADCSSEIFDQYVGKVTSLYPGFAASLFEKFTGPAQNPISYIGKQERLVEDLIELLTLWRERFSEQAIRAVAPLNATGPASVIGEDICRKIYFSEKDAFERYGYSLTG